MVLWTVVFTMSALGHLLQCLGQLTLSDGKSENEYQRLWVSDNNKW